MSIPESADVLLTFLCSNHLQQWINVTSQISYGNQVATSFTISSIVNNTQSTELSAFIVYKEYLSMAIYKFEYNTRRQKVCMIDN